jgi:hypothetical protein
MPAIVYQFGANTDRAKSAMAQLASSVASNMNTVASVMGSTALTTTAATTAMGSGFGNAALAVARFALQYRTLLVSLAVVGLAINAAVGDLTELVTIGDKAARVKLSPETFQAFTREAEKSRIAIKDAEAALTQFNAANKRRFDPSNEQTPSGQSQLGQFLKDLVLVQQQLQGSTALDAFLNSPDQNARLRATIDLIRELQAAGQDLAAQTFAEKAFGGAGEKIAEEISKGKFALDDLTAQGKAAGLIFSNELVQRAVDLRDRLEAAAREIGDNLKPLLEGSATLALGLGSALASGVEAAAALARGVNTVYSALVNATAAAVDLVAKLGQVGNAQAANQAAILQQRLRDPGLTPQQRAGVESQLRGVQGRQQLADDANPFIPLPQAPVRQNPNGVIETGRGVFVQVPPNSNDRPTPRAGRGGGGGGGGAPARNERLEEIEAFIKQLERQNRLIEAEVQAVGRSAAEREKLIAIAKIGSDLTDKQRQDIERVAAATGNFRDRLKELEEQQRRVAEAGRFMGDAIADAFSDAIFNGTKLNQVAQNLLKSLGSTALKGLLTGGGPFGIAPGKDGALGGLLGGIFSLLPKFDVGTDNVPRDMVAMVHKGEMIIPAAEASAIRSGRGGGTGSIGGGTVQVFITAAPELPAMIRAEAQGVAVKVTQQGIAANNSRIPAMLAQQESR